MFRKVSLVICLMFGSAQSIYAADTKSNPTLSFSSNLRQSVNNGENILFSPTSIITVLGMCSAGANGDTRVAFETFFMKTQDEQKDFVYNLNKEISTSNTQDCEVVSANALWVQNDLKINDLFKNTITRYYKGKVNLVDYKNKSDDAIFSINDWCKTATRGKIPTIVNNSLITPETRLTLTNAVYFNGKWKQQFRTNLTKPRDFTDLNGEVSRVPMMCKTMSDVAYMEDENLQAIDLEYKGDLSMTVFLFRENSKGLSYKKTIAALKKQMVDVYLPKFEISTEYQLKEYLTTMGLENIFSDDADFSGITTTTKLKVSEVVHKAYIRCYEDGTEAAAVTAGAVAAPAGAQPKEFKANRPFMFVIRNRRSDNILFYSAVNKL